MSATRATARTTSFTQGDPLCAYPGNRPDLAPRRTIPNFQSAENGWKNEIAPIYRFYVVLRFGSEGRAIGAVRYFARAASRSLFFLYF
jgi:hypothetical protein